MKHSTGYAKPKSRIIQISAFFFIASFATMHAQTIKGTIVGKTNGALPGANISIVDENAKAVTSIDGDFSLLSPKLGEVNVKVEYIGYETQYFPMNLKEGTNDIGYITIIPENKKKTDKISDIQEVTISRPNALTQAKAYEIKKNNNAIMEVIAADAIGKLPDRNAAEAVQRVQGVAVARYHGEADQATVRGTPFAWTSALFNGNRLPSANVLGNRSFVLDVVPSELIQFVQVSKAITPDMDGDAIGGSINFITRTAPVKKTFSVSGAGGYNTFSKDGTYNASAVYGDRFFKNKLGVLLSGAIWERQWGADAFDVSYNTGSANEAQRKSINTVMMKRYMGTRRTIGLNGGLEYKFNSSNKVFFRGMYNKFDDIRPVYETYVDYTNARYQYNFRYSHYQTELYGMELGGEHSLTSKLSLDWMASNYQAKYFLDTPPTNSVKGLPISTFRQKITGGFKNLSSDGKRYWSFDSPNGIGGEYLDYSSDTADSNETLNADKLLLSQLVISKLDNNEKDRIARFNLKYDVNPNLSFKVGAKYRDKDRESTFGYNAVFAPTTSSLLSLSQLSTTEPAKGTQFLNGMNNSFDSYIVNPPTKDQLFQLFSPSFLQQNGFADRSSAASNATSVYTGEESVFAAYAMAEIKASDKFKIVGGFRNESTRLSLYGSKATTEKSATPGGAATTVISPSVVESNYSAFLPMLHLRYNLSPQTNVRFAYTRSFIRPNFGDMSPGSSVDNTSTPFRITRGNPDLQPTFSHNFDLMGEHYFNNIGIISGGVFYKKISNIVFSDTSMMNVDGTDYMVTQAKNLQDSELLGFEAGINKRFDFLNGFWSGFGVEFNYTFIDSKVEVPRTTTNGIQFDKTSLPNQSKNLFNAILYYESNKVMIRLAGNFRGKSVETINQNLGPQYYIWSDKNFTIDFSASYDITKKVKLFIELNNLNNESLRLYMGDNKKRITSNEWYGSRGQLGVRWQIF